MSFKSLIVFEDQGICDFTDTIEDAIRKAYAVVTGEELKTKNDCEAICILREKLCERFHGCYPGWFSDDDATGEDITCLMDCCVYRCNTCPMLEKNAFPFFELESDEVNVVIAELIRCVKCNKEYNPTSYDVDYVIECLKDIS